MKTRSHLSTAILSCIAAIAAASILGCHPGDDAQGPGAEVDHPPPARLIPIEDFFRNPEQTDFELSPDGSHLAWVGPHDGVLNLYMREIGRPGGG